MIKETPKALWLTQKSPDPPISKDALFEHFSQFGTLLSILTIETSKSQIISKIEFQDESTELLILKIPIHKIDEAEIEATYTSPIEPSQKDDEQSTSSVILFEQISVQEWCQHSFRAFAASFGQVNKYWFDKDPKNHMYYIATIEYDGIVKSQDLSNDPEILKRQLKVSTFDSTQEGHKSPNLIEAEFQNPGAASKHGVGGAHRKQKKVVKRSRKRFFAQNLKGLNLLEFEDKENIQQLKAAALKNIKVNIYHYYSNLRFNSFRPKCKNTKKIEKESKETGEKVKK